MAAHEEFVFCEQSIERTIAWIMRNRRMSRDYKFLSETTEALIYVAMIRLMLRRLANADS
jgi:putative transposase